MAFGPTARRSAAPAPRPSTPRLRSQSWSRTCSRSRSRRARFDQLTPSARCLGGFGCRRQGRPGRHGRDRAAWPAGARSDRPRRAASRHRRRAPRTRCTPLVPICVRKSWLVPIGGGRLRSPRPVRGRGFRRGSCNAIAGRRWVMGRGGKDGPHAGWGPGDDGAGRGPRADDDPGGSGRGAGRDHPGVPGSARPRSNRRTRRARLER